MPAVVHQGEAAGEEQHHHGEHRHQEPGALMQQDHRQPPEQAVGHQGVEDLPGTHAITTVHVRLEIKIAPA